MLDTALLPLRSERAVLRAMHTGDARAYAEGTVDASVREYAHLPEPEYTEASVAALIDGAISEGLERGDLAVLAIGDPSTGEFAGSLVLFDVTDDSVEVGFWVHPKHRGKGLAGAALSLAVILIQRSELTRLTARTVPENLASQRVLERAGFSRGDEVTDVAPSGEAVALLHYSRELVSADSTARRNTSTAEVFKDGDDRLEQEDQ
ncbi:GNAT family N-acetyltransferase [Brevibacterium luteolum]|uniref:N-acetyltransferase n=1 Tax=Brevibacterium luteolum TaxID=199591 RepID=A0A6G8KXK6_9MICO|nr:GNAT family protein [Brevibacterium luteolum]MBU8579428.1 GNAT family N-acetyltransferase [Brevibacterium luteolum]QIN29538.1 N-acetyltransferase [Brevibacterium luteolum]